MSKIKEAIDKGIEKGKEAGKKAKEYLIDDTAEDLKKLLATNPKAKVLCGECGEELTKHEKEGCVRNEVAPICFACAIRNKAVK